MAGLGRSQGDLRFPGPLGLAHRTQQHPVPSFFFFSCQKPKRLLLPFQGKDSGFFFFFFFFFFGGGGWRLLLCGHLSSCPEQEPLCSCCVQASHCGGFSCGAWARGHWASVVVRRLSSCSSQALAQKSWRTRLAAPRHVGGFRARDLTGASCIGRRILYH